MAISSCASTPRLSVYMRAISGSLVLCCASCISRRGATLLPMQAGKAERNRQQGRCHEAHGMVEECTERKPIWPTRINGSHFISTGSQTSLRGTPLLPAFSRA